MEEKHADFRQHHSRQFLKMALGSDRHAKIENPDGYGKHARGCGDTVEFFLSVRSRHIRTISIATQGCLNTNACANALAHMAEGKTIEDAWQLTPEDVVAFLETLPEAEIHCAELAVGAFYRALANYCEMQRSPWKKPYCAVR